MPLWLKAFSEALRPVASEESGDTTSASQSPPVTPSRQYLSPPSTATTNHEVTNKIIHIGWAQKKGVLGTWRRRWLVCSKWSLATYKTDHAGAEPTKVLDLHDVSCEYIVCPERLLVLLLIN